MSKHILDLKSKPNLGYGVNVRRISSEAKKYSRDVKPRMPIKKKLKNIKDLNSNRGASANDIYNIWGSVKTNSSFDKIKYKSTKPFWIIIILLAIVAFVGYLGWNFFSAKPLSGDGVALEISGDYSVVSGDRAKLTIKYENKEQVKVKNVELRINYPDGVYYVSSNSVPDNLGMNIWKLKDLKPGQKGKLNLDIQVIGDVGSEINLEAAVTYAPVNFNSNFESKISQKIKIEKVLMELGVESPSEIGNNNRVSYNISYKNVSSQNLSNFRIRLEYPNNFSVIETSGTARQDGENIWIIDELKKEENGSVNISGFLDLANNTSSTFNAVLEIKSLYSNESNLNKSNNLEWLPYLNVSKNIGSMPVDANLRVSVNGSPIDSVVNWSDELKYEIFYKNNTEQSLDDVSVSIKLDSKYLDLASFKDDFGGKLDKKNYTISWDKSSVPSFAKLEKGQEGKINFSMKLLKFKDEYIGKDDYYVKSESYLKHDKTTDDKKIISNFVINKINSPLQVLSKVRYYNESGQAVGSGPLPPVVGEATTYEVIWEIKPLASNLSDVSIRTVLPPYIDWGDGFVFGEENIVYNSETREVVWQLQKIEKSQKHTARFNVVITPDKNHANKVATLINQTKFFATDLYSLGKLEINTPYLTTELLGDKKASGKSKVIDL